MSILEGQVLSQRQMSNTVYRIPEKEASLVESVLLFTDGKANVGIRTQAPLVKATRSAYLFHIIVYSAWKQVLTQPS